MISRPDNQQFVLQNTKLMFYNNNCCEFVVPKYFCKSMCSEKVKNWSKNAKNAKN